MTNNSRRYFLLLIAAFGFAFSDPRPARSEGVGDLLSATPTVKKVDLPPLYIAEVKGEVFVIHKGDKTKADPPQALEADDRIVTGDKGKAYLQFKEGGTMEVGPKSDMKVREVKLEPDTFRAKFLMAFGKVKSTLHKLTTASSSFEIEAGGVVAGVRGTVFEVDYDKEKNNVVTKTFEGSVFSIVGGKEQIVEKGLFLAVGKGNALTSGALSLDDINDFTEFVDLSGDLEKKKAILLKQLEKRLLEKVTRDLFHRATGGKSGLGIGHLPF